MTRFSKKSFFLNLTHHFAGKALVSSLLVFSTLVSCTPSSKPNTSIFNNYGGGGDKKDDGGYGNGGTGDGGGGQGILCSAEAKNPAFKSKLFVRDIFEASYNYKLKIKDGPKTSQEDPNKLSSEEIQFLISTLKRYFGHATGQLEIGNSEFWNKFVSNISFIDDDAKLFPSQDANSPIALPNGCNIVQIAYWDDSPGSAQNGTLYVDKKLWLKLDSLNKLALLAHEYFFKEARLAGFKNSDFVRAKVGQLFSDFDVKPLFRNWKPSQIAGVDRDALPKYPDKYKFCRGTNTSDPTAEIHLYFYDQSNFTIPFLKSKKITMSSLQGFDFDTGPDPKYPLTPNKVSSSLNIIHLMSFLDPRYLNDIERDITSERFSPGTSGISDIIGRRMKGAGIDKGTGSSVQWLSVEAETSAELPKVVWSSQAFTPISTLTFELENPVEKNSEEEIPELKNNINAKIFELFSSEIKELSNSAGTTPEGKSNRAIFDIELDKEIVRLFSILVAEVGQAQRDGNYTDEYPNWTKSLQALVKKLFILPPKIGLDQITEGIDYRYRHQMYKATLGILTLEEKNSIDENIKSLYLKKNQKNSGLPYSLKKGRILVKREAEEVSFDLTCESAGETYTKFLDNKWNTRGRKLISSPIKYNFEPSKFPAHKNMEKADIDRILSKLSGRPESTKESDLTNLMPSDKKSLLERLKSVNEVSILPCYVFDPGIEVDFFKDPDSRPPRCLIVGINEDLTHFMIIEEDDDWVSDIEQVYEDTHYSVRAITPPMEPEE